MNNDKNELPKEFLNNMKKLLDDDYQDFVNSYNESSLKGLRVNTNKISISDLQKLMPNLTDKIEYENAFFVNAEEKFGNTPYHHAGLFYMQEPSAMLPVICANVQEDDFVLDMCSAPGGKSGQIANKLGKNGLLVSNEVVSQRAKILKENMERLGIENNIVINTNINNLINLGNVFDKVFVDAPCSGEGMFRKENEAIKQWTPNINDMNAKRQLEILNIAKELVRKGGKLIYSTCTFSKKENEDVIDEFLKENQNFKLAEIDTKLLKYVKKGVNNIGYRVYPHLHNGEGQYMCVLQEINDYELINIKPLRLAKLGSSEVKITNEFFKNTLGYTLDNIKIKDGIVLSIPNKEINTRGIFVLKYGTNIGKIENGHITPNHNFFTVYGDKMLQSVSFDIDAKELQDYLKGEQIEVDDKLKGYVSVKVNGHTIGGGKASNGRLNNLYPKHLRVK